MASVISGNQIKLNNGQTVTAQNGGWYDAQQFFNGSLGSPGVGNNPSQTDIYGKQAPTFNAADAAYVKQQQASYNPAPAPAPTPAPAPQQSAPSGGSQLPTGSVTLPQQPAFDLVGATNAAYNTPEIIAANKAITDTNAKITARQQALADAQAEINDNPFYSEATRIGKSQKLSEKANADITVLQNESNQAQNQVASLKADAAIKVNAAMGQYNINRQAYQDTLSNFNNLVSSGALDNANPNDLATLSVQTGIPMSMIQSIQQQSIKRDNPVEKPSIIQSTDNEGNLTILAVDPITGKIINQTEIAGAGKGKTGSGSGATTDVKAAAVEAAKSGKTYQDMLAFFTQYGLTAKQVYDTYTAQNYYGRPPDNVDPKTGLPKGN